MSRRYLEPANPPTIEVSRSGDIIGLVIWDYIGPPLSVLACVLCVSRRGAKIGQPR